ncbi:unnamed protein product [Pieris macdunnoughi]|uniref:NADP-dependent oxidoreductase domain-containing protein n=1 Tax=Pieris macdunnoughi TaxID=345717 RepID=A0A821ULC0_9NEOP|nr:unnamed protein product [Pieris macdunnoughi]
MGKVPVITFNNGKTIPAVGLGTWKSKPGEVETAVKAAIDIGYRHIDCAYVYGNEKEVGDAIAAKIKEGVVKREDLFITSKLWNTFHRPDLVKKALNETLANLQLKYLDLYLVHWPHAYKAILVHDLCQVKSSREQNPFCLRNKDKFFQVECHPCLNQMKRLILQGQSKNHPLLPSWLCFRKIMGHSSLYQIDRGNIVIPKSANPGRIASNFQVFDFKLSQEDVQLINTFDCNGRFVPMSAAVGHKDHPFENVEF